MKKMNRLLTLLLALGLLLAACSPSAPDAPPPAAPTATAAPPTDPTEPPPTPEPAQPVEDPASGAWASQQPPLPADPQAVIINTPDDRTLNGWYYPAAVNPAPLVILMHWAGGDQYDWWEIAPWLQNRPGEYTPGEWSGTGIRGPWLDPSWFPALRPEASFGVLVFDLSGFGTSPQGNNIPTDWLVDSQAAIEFAATLPGIDPDSILVAGASIGADGVLDGCVLASQAAGSPRCLGVFSLSPGNYLPAPFVYPEGARALADAGIPVHCLAAEGDTAAAAICNALQPPNTLAVLFPGNAHAMALLAPEVQASQPADAGGPLDALLAWLELAIDRPVKP